ncbi:heparan-alpha-glucosaminide N-acetyltransferase [Ensifer sp. P24N7]|uniref:heparan-alpha-glucosaminide N-acetyltransferase n=1 Tax=Sinorhizobium sp. P24N7 TaxID=3348358 RepID=UPI0035F4B844
MPPETNDTRIWMLDAVRGTLILGVVIFHIIWNLESFGVLPFSFAESPISTAVSRIGAAGFLSLVGVGVKLAYGKGFRAAKFAARVASIAACAMLISVATYALDSGSFIYFGILHVIAAATLVSVLLLRAPPGVCATIGMIAIALPHVFNITATVSRTSAWTGLTRDAPDSLDFYPFFRWAGWVFLGMALTTPIILVCRRLSPPGIEKYRLPNVVAWVGRRSLTIYMLHQPILYGLLGALVALRS